MFKLSELSKSSTRSGFSKSLSVLCVTALTLLSGFAHAAAGDAAQVVFVAGDVQAGNKSLPLNSMVNEGTEIRTGADGFVYLKTIDNGFLIVRPNSTIRIVAYQVDKQKPENTHIKLELLKGVARSISGDAVKLSRQNFRFNTPIAAIGVRGTDFTVFTDQTVSRVSVLSGGIVVSGFGGSCSPTGTGPCEGASSVELFAAQQGKLLQINKDQIKPSLFNSGSASPDVVSPPRKDEPTSVTTSPVAVVNPVVLPNNAVTDPLKNTTLPEYIQTTQNAQAAAKALENSISWGRWTNLMGLAPTLDSKLQAAAQAKLIAANPYFAIYQSKTSEWQVPVVGGIGFALKGGEAYVIDDKLNTISSAGMENGKLQIDFATATFSTAFDLVTQSERIGMYAQGSVSPDGKLFGNSQFSAPTNMSVNGVVTAEKGGSAAYLFQRRLDNDRQTYGATYWTK